MTKNNKNKGKNPKPIPLTKYTNILVGKEKKKSFTDVVEFYKRTGLLPVMNDSSVEKAVKWYLYDLRNNKDNSISKEKEKQTKSLAKRYSKDRKTKATESELLILSEINKIGLSDIKNPRDAKTTLTDRGLILLNVRELDNTVGSSDGISTEENNTLTNS